MTTTLLTLKNKAYIERDDPRYAEALNEIIAAINKIQTGQSIVGAPSKIGSLSVTQTNGDFDAVITDYSAVVRGITYFVEYSTDPNFINPPGRIVASGTQRTFNFHLGSLTGANIYFRAYSAYQNSAPSQSVYASQNPIVSGGAVSPAPQTSTGSGTASGTGQQPGQGFGNNPVRHGPNGAQPIFEL